MPWAGLQIVIVVFPDHTHLLLDTWIVIVTLGLCTPKESFVLAFHYKTEFRIKKYFGIMKFNVSR